MHELALTREIVAIVCEAAGGRRVHKVTLEIGQLSCVMPEAIEFCFDAVAHAARSARRRAPRTIRRTRRRRARRVTTMEIEEAA